MTAATQQLASLRVRSPWRRTSSPPEPFPATRTSGDAAPASLKARYLMLGLGMNLEQHQFSLCMAITLTNSIEWIERSPTSRIMKPYHTPSSNGIGTAAKLSPIWRHLLVSAFIEVLVSCV